MQLECVAVFRQKVAWKENVQCIVDKILYFLLFVLIIFFLLILKFQNTQQNATVETRADRQKILQQKMDGAEIVEEHVLDENGLFLVAVFSLESEQKNGLAFFQKNEMGNYMFKSACAEPAENILLDNIKDTDTNYLVFFKEASDLSHAEVTFQTAQEQWTELYNTNGLLIVPMPNSIQFSCKIKFFNQSGEIFE